MPDLRTQVLTTIATAEKLPTLPAIMTGDYPADNR